MKSRIIILFVLLASSFLMDSCYVGKSEWWEEGYMTEKREKRLSERNDDSKMESFMFEKME